MGIGSTRVQPSAAAAAAAAEKVLHALLVPLLHPRHPQVFLGGAWTGLMPSAGPSH